MPDAPSSMGDTFQRVTGGFRIRRPVLVQKTPPCQNACPAGSDVESWIRLFDEGRVREACEAALVENPFPSVTGRVCHAPCGGACSRSRVGGAVNIKALERAVGDAAAGELTDIAPFFEQSGKRIAVIGAGPSGLACAYHLARFGHSVTVFERERRAGGMLRYGMPAYRLPREVIDRETARLETMGIEILTARPVPSATHLQTLRQEFNAVYISVGATRPRPLGLDQGRVGGVLNGLEYLKNAAEGRAQPHVGKVAVVGGGHTAVEAARCALRLGADVTLIFNGAEEDMSAFPGNIRSASAEGVRIEPYTEAVRLLTAGGKISGVMCRRLADDNRETEISADILISAQVERCDLSIIPSALHVEDGSVKADQTGRTEWLNVFAGGDFLGERRSVADALAAGKRSAVAIDCLLRGESAERVIEEASVQGTGPLLVSRFVRIRTGASPVKSAIDSSEGRDAVVGFGELNCAYFRESAPNPSPSVGNDKISRDPFAEATGPLEESALKAELGRCFHCGRCTQCDNCHIYCPDVSIAKRAGGYDIDLDHCKGCGICSAECPRAAIEMVEERGRA